MEKEKPQSTTKEITSALEERRKSLDINYDDQLTRAVPESAIISLSEIPEDIREERISQLNLKLAEYKERQIHYFYKSDELEDAWYKGEILRILMNRSYVHATALELAIQKESGGIYEKGFNNAIRAIREYVVNGGQGNRDGTGLVQINS